MSRELIEKNRSDEEWKEKIELWKRTYMKGASDDEMLLFESVCKRTGLSPELRQIHAIPREDWETKKITYTLQVSIDGYRLMADRTGKYAPGREPTFTYNKEGKLVSATSYVKKMTADGTWHEVAATAFYNEYVQTFKNRKTGEYEPTKFWKNSEHNQLSKCAEALALRKGFPGDLSNIYTFDEMAQAKNYEEEKKPQEIEERTAAKAPSMEEELAAFKDRFKPIENLDHDLTDFLMYITSKSKKFSHQEIVRQALESPEKFAKSYLKWTEEKTEETQHMNLEQATLV